LVRFQLFSLAGLALCLPGCASFGSAAFESPTVDLQSIVVKEVTTSGATLDVLLAVANPNVFAIDGARMEMTLDIDDVRFGEVSRPDPLHLPGGETTDVWVPIRFTWAGIGAAAREMLASGRVSYVIEGGIDLETPYGNGHVPYQRSGSVPLLSASAADPLTSSGR
jgi:LEA14-like dessication related protein